MMSGVCYKAGSERGAWYELKCLRETITGKEASGQSAAFERSLYRAWLKLPDYARADKENRDKGFYGDLIKVKDKREPVSKIIPDISDIPQNFETSQEGILTTDGATLNPNKNHRGRPRKSGEVSRITAWRRGKEAVQGVLV